MAKILVSTAIMLSCFLASDAAAQKKQTKKEPKASEWVDGVAFTTDWKTAIKAVQQSGKMLFIYNGWERKGI